MPSKARARSCYIAAPAGTDLKVLTRALEQHGYSVLFPGELVSGQRWIDALSASLTRADLIVGVFPPGPSNANVAFEVGWGAALGKNVLVIVSPAAEDIPFAISSLMVVRAEPNAAEAIGFALTNLREVASTPRLPTHATPSRGARVADVEGYRAQLRAAATEEQVNRIFRQLLLDSGFEVVANARAGIQEADFAAWSDELGAYVGNPLIIEIKRDVAGLDGLHRAAERLTKYLSTASARWGLLLYDRGPSADLAEMLAARAPQVLLLSFDELLRRLQTARFVDIVRDLRNRRVHGVGR